VRDDAIATTVMLGLPGGFRVLAVSEHDGWRSKVSYLGDSSERASDVRRPPVEPHGNELIAPVRQSHIDVLPGPAERDRLDVLLAVVGPEDASHDGHRKPDLIPEDGATAHWSMRHC
jgi:hypothetical protein